jgi:hypothetical protein
MIAAGAWLLLFRRSFVRHAAERRQLPGGVAARSNAILGINVGALVVGIGLIVVGALATTSVIRFRS